MISFPFDSVVTYDADGNPSFDRAANSEILSSFLHLIFTNGVFPDPSTGLQVVASSQDMSVIVKPGNINIQGRMGIEEAERTLVFEASGTVYDRIDSVVARMNNNYEYRKIDLYILKGTESSSPVAPDLTRIGGIYEMRLANVFIAKNTTTISAERITDTRLNSDDCGIVTANPKAIDSKPLFEQFQAELAAFKAGREADFLTWQQGEKNDVEIFLETMQATITTWFETMKGQLDEDAAANLQNQIDMIKGIYVNEHTLCMPNTSASVSDHTLTLGTTV